MTLLSIKDLNVAFVSEDRRVVAVDSFSYDINEGESLGIVGESGSGKTTLIMAVMRLLPEDRTEVSGQVMLGGLNLLTLSDSELTKIRWMEIALVFQKAMGALSPVHRIGAFMLDIYKIHKPETTKESGRKRIEELLALVNLPSRVYDLYPHELSGGMMQRVSIALSLMFNPKLLILDEATTALDVVTQTQILEEIIELEKTLGITRIMITHDISVVASSCKNVAVLYAGRLVEAGAVRDVLVNPAHPYTQGLIDSFPKQSKTHEPLASIGGSLPDLSNPPAGCIFFDRCKYAEENCRANRPKEHKMGDGRIVSCHRAEQLKGV